MKFINLNSTETDPQKILTELTPQEPDSYDIGFLFMSALGKPAIKELASQLKTKIKVSKLIGCTCAGIISSDHEIEYKPAATLILGKFPGVTIKAFSINQAQLEELDDLNKWYDFLNVFPNEKPKFIVFPDPFVFDMDYFLQNINQAFPKSPVIGGLASGAQQPKQNTLFIDNEIFEEGLIGITLTGNVDIDTIVSQGCRPIGENFIVTKSEGNVLYELAGKPLYQVLKGILDKAPARDKLLAQEAIFVGIAMDEYKDNFKRGDFLIRGLLGIDPNSGAGIIADYVNAGQTVQFHVRDAATATEDLNELLNHQKFDIPVKPQGALVFSCNGRGMNLFREKDHDINIIQKLIGPVPAAGFFCAGEIGPIGGSNFLHGFTSSIALFYPGSTTDLTKTPA